MSKRARGPDGRFGGGSVTGGTGDIKPQILTLSSTEAPAINEYAVANFRLPVSRFVGSRDVTTIVEMLKVWWYPNMEDTSDISADNFSFLTTATSRNSGDTSTSVTFLADLNDSRTFANVLWATQGTITGATTITFPVEVDLTDGNGNGVLVATDSIFVVGGGVGNTNAGEYVCKILYRLVNVGIQEYVGIVQSQQGG